jgi:putative oxidoreductase
MDIFTLNSLALLAPIEDIVLLVVRIIFGVIFFYYGWPKLKDLKSNASDFEHMGFKPGWLWGTPVALLETIGALMIIVGLFTWLAAIGFAVHMVTGTIWKITKTDKPFTDWSYDLMLLSIALLLLITGPGAINILVS